METERKKRGRPRGSGGHGVIHRKYRKRGEDRVKTSMDMGRELWNQLGHLALDERKSRQMLVEEAIRELLKSRGWLREEATDSPVLEA